EAKRKYDPDNVFCSAIPLPKDQDSGRRPESARISRQAANQLAKPISTRSTDIERTYRRPITNPWSQDRRRPVRLFPSLAHKYVAIASNGLHDLRLFRICLDFSPDPRHSNIDATVENIGLAVVCDLQQLVSAQNAVRVRGECLEQIEFHARQRDLLAPGV